jgi:hypothetical protein
VAGRFHRGPAVFDKQERQKKGGIEMRHINKCDNSNSAYRNLYRVHINYRGISLRHNLSKKCRKIVNIMSITHSERKIWNGPIVATAISREKRKPVLEGNGCLADRA